MKVGMYAVFDVKAGVYNSPFFVHTDGLAERGFADIVTDATSVLAAHPEDYTLFRVGTWDDQRGWLEPESPRSLGTGIEFVARREIDGGKIQALHEEIEAIKKLNGEDNAHSDAT